jgi:terminase small subunit / prophage DNA-packing protein
MTRWVSLNQLAAETGLAVRSLQYIRAQEPGVLVHRQRGKVAEYEQPTCAINLRQREVRKHAEANKPADFDEARTRREQANAEIAEMQLAKLRAELAPVADMVAQVERIAGAVRAEVLGLRSRFVGRIVGLKTELEAAAVIDAMAAQVLAALVDRVGVDDDDEMVEDAA